MRLILIRHGETYWNEEQRVQGGGSDIELNETGVKQANKVALYLKEEKIAAIISSPLKRALATAKVIASLHGLPIEVDARLKEIDIGELEGLSLNNLGTTFTRFLIQLQKERGATKLPSGESLVELQERSWATVEHLLQRHKLGTVVVVSHYFVILTIICQALDLPLKDITKFKLDPAGVSILDLGDYGPRLAAFNDTSYLNVIARSEVTKQSL